MRKLIALLLLPLLLLMLAAGTRRPLSAHETRAATWTLTSVADFRDGECLNLAIDDEENGKLVLAEGSLTGSYTSPIKEADFSFNAVGAKWEADLPQGARVVVEVRTRPEGGDWSPWIALAEVDQWRGLGASAADLVMASGRYLQCRLHLTAQDAAYRPVMRELTIIYLDSTAGPSLAQAQASAVQWLQVAGIARPAVIPRAGWGANEDYRLRDGEEVWPPEHAHPEKIILHHTATSNTDSDPVAMVRAIYYYHAVVLGWGDIGYSYLVDARGNIYEGRYGGEKVVGGHASAYNRGSIGIAAMGTYSSESPSSQLENALASLISWACVRYGIYPTGSSFFIDQNLPNIMGHCDACNTTCPGSALYARLPTLRTYAWQRLPAYGEAWVSHETPASMTHGQQATVTVTLRNSGSRTWTTAGRYAFRLGYHWYDSYGNHHLQPPADDHRTYLPADVGPGQPVTLSARLAAPRESGRYTLKWDMVHEGFTWFADQGNEPLSLTVAVGEPIYRVQWGYHTTPVTMARGQTASAVVTMENRGSVTWVAAGRYAFHLGYRWYDADGRQYLQHSEEDHRTVLPQDLEPGQGATLTALVTAPRDAGRYTLKWDIVHEGYAWFADRGSPTLDVAVAVGDGAASPAPYRVYIPFVGRDWGGSW